MKKLLLLICMLTVGLCTWAQTSVETALDLVVGTNSYDLGESGSNTSIYYKYTAPSDQGQLLTLTLSDQSVSVSVSEDGTYNTYLNSITLENGTKRIYPVKKGQTVYIAANNYSGTSISFDAAVEACDVEAGASCDDAVQATHDAEFFVPSYYDRSTYVTNPTYIAYVADESGVLEMAFNSYVSGVTIQEGCEGTSESLTFNYDSSISGYSGKYSVEAGKTYILSVKLYSPLIATFTLTHPTEGSTCDLPFAISTSEANTLPAAAGKYWYQLMPEKSGFAVLNSDVKLTGGTVNAYSSCSAYSADATVSGKILMRVAVQSGQSKYFCIEKTESTEADEQFTVSVEEAQAGDSFDNPLALQEGENTVPLYNGTYYYSITLPEGSSKMINIDASSNSFLSSSTQMYLYNSSNQWSSVAYGTSSLSYEGTAGTTYILMWRINENENGFKFKVTLSDIAQGDVASNPLQAVLGDNELAEGTVKYYTYTATKSAWLCIDAEPTITVSFPYDASGYSYRDAQTSGTVTRIQATAGTTYLIKFVGMVENTTFTLSEVDYQQGESKDNPIEITEDNTALPTSVLSNWYVYTAPKTGKLIVSSDIAYETSGSKNSNVSVQINNGYEQVIIVYGGQEGSETSFKGSFNVNEGDIAYIHVVTLTAQKDRTLTCYVADLQPGEAASCPIPLKEGETIVPEASYNNPIWYSVELTQGELDIEGKTSNDYFYGVLYPADDTNSAVAYSSSTWDSSTNTVTYYLKYNYTGEEVATYLFCVQRTNAGGATIVVNGDNIVTGIQSLSSEDGLTIANGQVSAPAGQRVTIYDLNGRKLHDGQALHGVSLNKGIYIVNGSKVVVK